MHVHILGLFLFGVCVCVRACAYFGAFSFWGMCVRANAHVRARAQGYDEVGGKELKCDFKSVPVSLKLNDFIFQPIDLPYTPPRILEITHLRRSVIHLFTFYLCQKH